MSLKLDNLYLDIQGCMFLLKPLVPACSHRKHPGLVKLHQIQADAYNVNKVHAGQQQPVQSLHHARVRQLCSHQAVGNLQTVAHGCCLLLCITCHEITTYLSDMVYTL